LDALVVTSTDDLTIDNDRRSDGDTTGGQTDLGFFDCGLES
jgi:hypothetical protein